MASLRVGLAGFGYAGSTLHAPLIRTTPGLSLTAVSSRDPARVRTALGDDIEVLPTAAALAAHPGLDLLVIATPNDTHAPLARAALESGLHVAVDKPFALNIAEAAPLLELARRRGRVLSVFHNRRWDADFLTARTLLASGALGRVTEARMHFDRFRPEVRDRWREGSGPGAGLWNDLAPHLLDQALQLFGLPVALQADLVTLRDGGLSDDAFECRLRYANGLRVTLAASMLAAAAGPRFLLHGTKGSWAKWGLDTQEDALKSGRLPDPLAPQAWGEDPMPGRLSLWDGLGRIVQRDEPNQRGCWPNYYAALRDAMLGRGQNPVPATEALQVLCLQDLGRQSALERRELPVVAGPISANGTSQGVSA